MTIQRTGPRSVGAALLALAVLLAVQYVPAKRSLATAGIPPVWAAVLMLGAGVCLVATGVALLRQR